KSGSYADGSSRCRDSAPPRWAHDDSGGDGNGTTDGVDAMSTPTVLFLCTHNASRSLAAKVLLEHYGQGRIDVRSAGSEPGDQLNPAVVALLKERKLDPSREFPKPLTDDVAMESDVIV